MKRLYLFALVGLLPQMAAAYSNVVILTSASTSPWTINATYNAADSKIECIGRGGKGSARKDSSNGGWSGGGGAYAVLTNVNLGSGTAAFQVGSDASAVTTFIKNSSGTIQVEADYGRNSDNTTQAPGGAASSCTPTTGAFSGGAGRTTGGGNAAGVGGGGAGGPNGAGSQSATALSGGDADGGTVAGPTTQGAAGNSGTEFDATHGCGTGGAGGSGGGSRNGGAGGNYGGGGGGGNSGSNSTGGVGTSGLIVIQWNPAAPAQKSYIEFMNWFTNNKRQDNKPCLDNLLSLSFWQLQRLLALSRSTLLPHRMP